MSIQYDASISKSKRGRKIDIELPPSRSLETQRRFRARRANQISSLENKVKSLEEENRRLKLILESSSYENSYSTINSLYGSVPIPYSSKVNRSSLLNNPISFQRNFPDTGIFNSKEQIENIPFRHDTNLRNEKLMRNFNLDTSNQQVTESFTSLVDALLESTLDQTLTRSSDSFSIFNTFLEKYYEMFALDKEYDYDIIILNDDNINSTLCTLKTAWSIALAHGIDDPIKFALYLIRQAPTFIKSNLDKDSLLISKDFIKLMVRNWSIYS